MKVHEQTNDGNHSYGTSPLPGIHATENRTYKRPAQQKFLMQCHTFTICAPPSPPRPWKTAARIYCANPPGQDILSRLCAAADKEAKPLDRGHSKSVKMEGPRKLYQLTYMAALPRRHGKRSNERRAMPTSRRTLQTLEHSSA